MEHKAYQVMGNGLFGTTNHTQGGFSHLMQHAWDEYVKHLAKLLEEKKRKGQKVVSLEEAKKRAPATDFAEWFTAYLDKCRPVDTFFVDNNVGIRLNNGIRLAVSPTGDAAEPERPDSGAVAITEGKDDDAGEMKPMSSLRL